MATIDPNSPIILIVEDDELHASAIQRSFDNSGYGFRLHIVSSLDEALKAMAHQNPALLITDYKLPDGDGIWLLVAAKGEFPVILMTSQGNEQVAVDAIKAGAQDYIVKSASAFESLPLKVKYALDTWNLVLARRKADEAVSRGKRDWERTFDAVPDLIAIIDLNHTIIRVNRAMAERFGLQPADLAGKRCCSVVHGQDTPPPVCPAAGMMQDGLVHRVEIEEKSLNSVYDVTVSPLFDDDGQLASYVHVMRDVTQHKKTDDLVKQRLKLRDTALASSVDELMQATLDACELLTDSSIGFFHLVDEDQQHLTLQAWSSNTLATMCSAEGRGLHYPISEAGIWAECFHSREPVIHNDYASSPNRKGLPSGHAPVTRELTVPVVVNDKVTSIIGVGNKTTPYTQHDAYIVRQFVTFATEVIGRKKAIVALEESEKKFRQLATEQWIILQASSVGICFLKERKVLWANPAFDAILGFETGTTINMDTEELYADNNTYEYIGKTGYPVIETGEIYSQDVRMKKRDGSTIWCNLVGQAVTKGTLEDGSIWVIQDITERKTIEEERSLMITVYNLLNRPGDLNESVKEIIGLLKANTAFEAVGIRMQEDEDFPYFEAIGFPAEFIATENLLCTRDPSGDIVRDSCGNPMLECMCGNVLQGKYDPSLPFFTPSGSFWTNSTSALLATTTEADRQARTRNRCNGEGYESVALIPMKSAGQVFGLVQFNDRRPNCFTPEMIALFERVADTLAIALSNKKALQALQESTTRFSQVSDQACELIWEVDHSGLYTYVSKGCLAVTGYTQEEIVGKMHFYDLHPDEDREAFKAEVFGMFERRECIENLLNPVLTKSGIIHWVKTNGLPILGTDRQLLGYRGTDADVTNQKYLEETLFNQALLYQDLLETSQALIWRSDPQGRFTYVNPAWEEAIGYQIEDFIGKTFTDFQSGEIDENDIKNFIKQAAVEEVKGFEIQLSTKAQEVIHVLLNSKPMQNDKGIFTGISGTAYDITERRIAEMRRLAMEEKFQQTQKLESLGVLAGGIAHDFNNILSIIIGHCYLVSEDIDSEIDPKTHIKQIEKSAKRAADLCRQMLSYAGENEMVQTRINLWMLVDENIKMLQSALKKNVAIKLDLKYDVPQINGDIAQIQQVVMNLIINAAEAIGNKNGTIRVELKKVTISDGQMDVDFMGNVIQPGEYACLKVMDDGCGMDSETQKRIFEPFFTTKFAGRGLGMSAVLGIIKSHDGYLQLSSTPGIGTVFSIYLPLPLVPVFSEPAAAAGGAPAAKCTGTVLLVDDEEALRIIGTALLKAMGFTVTTAANGRDALEIFSAQVNSIDLILLDLLMPEMDGIETYHKVREISSSVPVVICSGYSVDDIMNDIDNDQNSAVVQKPYNPDQLRSTLLGLI